ncbi:CWF19-like protein 2 homolog isoform X2 [Oscarella lobularis]|uniref:CWF19-like protein 2 homolog isoform X2 n=1 Tax=Oscarella lobularis TaxID=121494 RepID=UPI003313686F
MSEEKWKAKLQKIWEEKKKKTKADGGDEKKRKKKEKKKHKKKKDKKEKEYTSPAPAKQSDDDDDDDDMWVEKEADIATIKPIGRDAWMIAPIPGSSSMFEKAADVIRRDEEEKDVDEKTTDHIAGYDPSRDSRELNPFWKKGGTGLPNEREDAFKESSSSFQSFERFNVSNRTEERDEREELIAYDDEKSESESEEEIVTDTDLNKLGAKITRAEIMGDTELAEKLKRELEALRHRSQDRSDSRRQRGGGGGGEETILLTTRDRQGNVRPLRGGQSQGRHGRRRPKEKDTSHDEKGKRTKYFADDDDYTLKDLMREEKFSTSEDYTKPMFRMTGRHLEKLNADFTLDDKFVSKAGKRRQRNEEKDAEHERRQAITEHKRMIESNLALDSPRLEKERIISIGLKVYLAVPSVTSLVEGHCQLIPCEHATSTLNLDEDVWSEMKIFRKGLVAMFSDEEKDVIFIENAVRLSRHPHMVIECIPVPKNEGHVARLYFKKAILECETEWAQNKKLIDTREKELRRSIPKGLPYFSVEFGLGGGYAHVIEDDRTFPMNFGQEIIGGLLELEEPYLWRKPQRESRDEQKRKASQLKKLWDPYDWTKKLDRNTRVTKSINT